MTCTRPRRGNCEAVAAAGLRQLLNQALWASKIAFVEMGSVLLPVGRLVRRLLTRRGHSLHVDSPLFGSSRFHAPANQVGQGRDGCGQDPRAGLAS